MRSSILRRTREIAKKTFLGIVMVLFGVYGMTRDLTRCIQSLKSYKNRKSRDICSFRVDQIQSKFKNNNWFIGIVIIFLFCNFPFCCFFGFASCQLCFLITSHSFHKNKKTQVGVMNSRSCAEQSFRGLCLVFG